MTTARAETSEQRLSIYRGLVARNRLISLLRLALPVAGFIDLAAEKARLGKEISALSADADPARLPNPGDALAFVHLNGCVDASPRGITFSRSQYAGRLASLDAFYERLTDDLLALPFVFVGTKLDESPLWQNLERRASLDDGHRVMRPRSFLVTARLDRARRALLEHVCIEWIQCSAQSFAERVLASLGPQVVAAGRTALRTPRNT